MQTAGGIIGSAEACRILGIDRSTLTRWAAAGRVQPLERLCEGRTGAFVWDREVIEALAMSLKGEAA